MNPNDLPTGGTGYTHLDRLFVLQCVRIAAGSTTEITTEPSSIERVTELLCYHKLVPLLYEPLSKLIPPSELRHKCRTELTQTVKRLHEKTGHYQVVQDILNGAKIPYAPLKGMSNLQTIYANKPLRFMNDLDLLVGVDDINRAYETLYAAGFRPTDPPAGDRIDDPNGRIMMIRDGIDLDLHWDPSFDEATCRNNPPKDFYWNNASLRSDRGTAYELAPERQLLLQCLHAAGDSFPRLIHMIDYAQLCRYHKLEASTSEVWIVEQSAVDYFRSGVSAVCAGAGNNSAVAIQFVNHYIDAPRPAKRAKG